MLPMDRRDFGPFRTFWCMPWEGYLPILKDMFRMCNYKSAPYSVAKHWATKSVMHYRDPGRGSWYVDTVAPSSEFYLNIEKVAQDSPLARTLLLVSSVNQPRPRSMRFLSSVTRDGEEVSCNAWVLVDQMQGRSRVARVDQIGEVLYEGSTDSRVRLYCTQCKVVSLRDDGVLWGAPGRSEEEMLVHFERSQVSVVVHTQMATHDEFM